MGGIGWNAVFDNSVTEFESLPVGGAEPGFNRDSRLQDFQRNEGSGSLGAGGGPIKPWKKQGLLAIKATTLRCKAAKPHKT
jgi:hypothetical protein